MIIYLYYILKENFILFELTNDNELKIISQDYFLNITSLKHLNEKNNIFYEDNIKEIHNYNSDDNKNSIVTIFY